MRRGQPGRAADCYRQVLKRAPQDHTARNNLAVSLLAQGRAKEAEDQFRAVLSAAPDAATWANLAQSLVAQGVRQGVWDAFEQALALDPARVSSWTRFGVWLLEDGQDQVAEQALQQALTLDPADPEARAAMAALLERRGQLEPALALLEGIPLGANGVLRLARVCRQLKRPTQALGPLNQLLEAEQGTTARSMLLHARGDLLHDLSQSEKAFADWTEANHSRGLPYDPDAVEARVQALEQAWTAFPEPPALDGPTVVLVVGMPRSGTSLVEQILDCHSQVSGRGERNALVDLEAHLMRQEGVDGPDSFGPALRAQAGRWYLDQLTAGTDAAVVVDKLPFNTWRLGLAASILPRLRIVWCERDPIDMGLSCFRQNFVDAHGFATRLEWIAHQTRMVHRLKQLWGGQLPLVEVSYEDLVRSPEDQIRALLQALELPFESACLRPQDNRRVVHTASNAQVRQPIHGRAVGSAERYAAWLGPLKG